MNLPVEIILTITDYLYKFSEILVLLDIFRGIHENISYKLIAWRYPKLFKVLNDSEIIGSSKVFESSNFIVSEISSIYKYLNCDDKNNSFNMQLQKAIFRSLVQDATLDYQKILSFVHDRILSNFDRNNPQLASKSTKEKEEMIKSSYSVITIMDAARKLMEHNKTFMVRLLIVLHRNNMEILDNIIQPSEFDLDIIIKLKIQLDEKIGSSILEHVIVNKGYILHFINYMNFKCFNLLSIQDKEEYIKSDKFKIEVISYKTLSVLVHQGKIELFDFIINHPDFKVTHDILKDACRNLNFQLLKVLLSHPSYKG